LSDEPRVQVSCSTHPQLFNTGSFPVSYKHRYSPPAVEAEIVQHYRESTNCIKKKFLSTLSANVALDEKIQGFLTKRDDLLSALSKTPEVESFLHYVLGLESQVENELDITKEEKNLEEVLEDEVEEVKTKETEAPETIKSNLREYSSLLDAISASILHEKKQNSGKGSLITAIIEYIESFLELINWLVDQRLQIKKYSISKQQLQQIISDVISCDILFASEENDKLGSEAIAIPLDFSPLRLALVSLLCGHLDAKVKNWNRMFSPPIFATLREGVPVLMKPYRSIDNHPIMMRIPQFDKDFIRFQEETKRAMKYFAEKANPLIEKLKSLTPYGKRGTQPILIRNHLVNAISSYIRYNPFSIENLRVMDLGCGSGSLLKDSYSRLLKDKPELAKTILLFTLLNDIIHFPGAAVRNASEKEEFAGKLDIEIREGDMRDLIKDAHIKKEHFDIAFINRVFDIYGGYGIFLFDKKDLPPNDLSLATVDTKELVPIEIDHKVVTFYQYGPFSNYCRAIAFLLNQSVDSTEDNLFLPAVEMNSYKSFFTFKGISGADLFNNLLDSAELIFVSVFPGSFESVFPPNETQTRIFHHQIIEPNTYSIILMSKDEALIRNVREGQ
jgi:hypothetical protein